MTQRTHWMPDAPNTIWRQNQRNIFELRWKCYGLIAATAEKRVSNRALANALGLDPRGTREILGRDPHFRVMILDEGRGLWWDINPEHPPLELPDDEKPKGPLIAVPHKQTLIERGS